MKRRCPCCGKLNLLIIQSKCYPSVLICGKCDKSEMTSNWYIKGKKSTIETTNYLNLRNEFSDAMQHRDEVRLNKVRSKRFNAEQNRIKKYVVIANKGNKQVALADFGDSNEAFAYVMTNFSKTYRQVTSTLWLSPQGEHVGVDYF